MLEKPSRNDKYNDCSSLNNATVNIFYFFSQSHDWWKRIFLTEANRPLKSSVIIIKMQHSEDRF